MFALEWRGGARAHPRHRSIAPGGGGGGGGRRFTPPPGLDRSVLLRAREGAAPQRSSRDLRCVLLCNAFSPSACLAQGSMCVWHPGDCALGDLLCFKSLVACCCGLSLACEHLVPCAVSDTCVCVCVRVGGGSQVPGPRFVTWALQDPPPVPPRYRGQSLWVEVGRCPLRCGSTMITGDLCTGRGNLRYSSGVSCTWTRVIDVCAWGGRATHGYTLCIGVHCHCMLLS